MIVRHHYDNGKDYAEMPSGKRLAYIGLQLKDLDFESQKRQDQKYSFRL